MSSDPFRSNEAKYGATPTAEPVVDALDEYAYAKTGEDAKQFRDLFWSILFYVHLAVVIAAVIVNLKGVEETSEEEDAVNGIVWLFVVTSVTSIVFSTGALVLMSCCLNQMIKAGLIFSVAMSLLVGLFGFISGEIMLGIFGILAFLIGACYAKVVWSRIPFAEANLKTALIAVKANWGLGTLAYATVILALVWSKFWFMAFGSALFTSNWGLLFGLLFSFYWVFNVLFNTLVVTSIGTVGTWWVAPDEADSCCSPGVKDSLFRSTTYSFGSVCLGSLLVAFIQALRGLVAATHNNDDCQWLACILDCFLSCIEGALEYLNKWAYVFVGLYGLNYVDAGKGVFELFQEKGWSSIISDDLCDRVLALICAGVGLLTGFVGVLFAYIDNSHLKALDLGDYELIDAFFIGLVVGLVFCNILMSVVGAAVNCVIVCFADSPREFEANHPELSAEMRQAWIKAWPDLAMFEVLTV